MLFEVIALLNRPYTGPTRRVFVDDDHGITMKENRPFLLKKTYLRSHLPMVLLLLMVEGTCLKQLYC